MEHPAPYDVIVLGGGVNGLGTARDCALRGLRVLLLERGDLASGASGGSSGLIHGGPRYMLSGPSVTERACRDSGFIQGLAPHLLFRIPFLLPFTSRRERQSLVERAVAYATEVFFSTYDVYQPLKRGKPSVRLTAEELYRLEPGLRPGLHGAVTFDEWGIDAHRLCVLNALSAASHGAEVRTWTEARDTHPELLTLHHAPITVGITSAQWGIRTDFGWSLWIKIGNNNHCIGGARISHHNHQLLRTKPWRTQRHTGSNHLTEEKSSTSVGHQQTHDYNSDHPPKHNMDTQKIMENTHPQPTVET